MTALLSAAAGGHVECVKLLIDDKCDINTTNPVGSFNILSNMQRVQKISTSVFFVTNLHGNFSIFAEGLLIINSSK